MTSSEKKKVKDELLPLLRKCMWLFSELEGVKGVGAKKFNEAYDYCTDCEAVLSEILLNKKAKE
jgi:hypothetical protein